MIVPCSSYFSLIIFFFLNKKVRTVPKGGSPTISDNLILKELTISNTFNLYRIS